MTERAGERLAGVAPTRDGFQKVPPRWRAAPWLAILLALVVVGGAGYAFGRRATSPSKTVVEKELRERDERIEVLLGGQGDLRNRLARLEVTLANRATPPPSIEPVAARPEVAATDDSEEPAPTPETIAAFDSAQAILTNAVRSGRWTETDRDRLRQAFGTIGDENRKAILRELAQAVNSGKLSTQGLAGPLL